MTFGLRGKSVLAILAAFLIAIVVGSFVGWRAIESVRDHLGSAFARNFNLLSKQRIVAPIGKELALSQRFADTESGRQWVLDENNTTKRDAFFKEAKGFQRDFQDHSYFFISALSNNLYANDNKQAFNPAPRYTLSKEDAKDAWFPIVMRDSEVYNLNVDVNDKLKVTNVWINVIMKDGDRKIGLAGTGLNLTHFLGDFINSAEQGVTPVIIDAEGAIQAHPNPALIALGSGSKTAESGKTFFKLLSEQDSAKVKSMMTSASKNPEGVFTDLVTQDGSRKLLALSYEPILKWHFLTVVDLKVARVLDLKLLLPVAAAVGLLLLLLSGAIVYGINRIVLAPLFALTNSAKQMADGNYSVKLPPAGKDEIGQMTSAFGTMVEQVKAHTLGLEEKVTARTRDLSEANRTLADANKNINDSIEYASLIQRSILPDEALAKALPGSHFALWMPRDVVGGDFHIFRELPDGFLIGIADCAGHGVPGACMTMLAHAIIDHCIDKTGGSDPAAIIKAVDVDFHAAISNINTAENIATNMDLGLAYVERATRRLTFCGAKMSLFVRQGSSVIELKGGRRPVGSRHSLDTKTHSLTLGKGDAIYLTSDGFLDQSGGDKGYGFGARRFTELLLSLAGKDTGMQRERCLAVITQYRNNNAQRDDITVVGFQLPTGIRNTTPILSPVEALHE